MAIEHFQKTTDGLIELAFLQKKGTDVQCLFYFESYSDYDVNISLLSTAAR